MKEQTTDSDRYKKLKKWATILSVIIPLAVAALFGIRIEGYDFSFLPPVYASINGITSLLLIVAVIAIKKKNVVLHKNLMKLNIFLGLCFLLMYVLYHITSDPTPYGGEGWTKVLYYFLLISHVLLSILVLPFVLFTYIRAISGAFTLHKKLARYTFPIWLYVSSSGVLVYLMISPYYSH